MRIGLILIGLIVIIGLAIGNPDPAGSSVPPCTDAIADAGGVCYGEPF